MIFWRILDNKLYAIDEVDKLGFEESEGLRIPDEYLEKQEFMVMRTAHGVGDWGIISAMPRLLKEKYPDCKVYLPSIKLLEKLFGSYKQNWGKWENPFKNVEYIFNNNPYVDGFKDDISGEIFHDHYRIYDNNNQGIPLVRQMLRFWQFEQGEDADYYPELYFSTEEKKKGNQLINEVVGDKEFGGLLITDRFDGISPSTGEEYDVDGNRMILSSLLEKCENLPFFYYTHKRPDEYRFNFNRCLDMRHIDTRLQLYIRSKAKINIGNHCGFLDSVSRYTNVFQVQRVFPLNHNIIELEHYVNRENYLEKVKYV